MDDARALESMPLDELWQLFPIVLREYNPAWPVWYAEERDALGKVFGDAITRITHIGSTSVPGLVAKPTVDILMELDEDADPADVERLLRAAGWLKMHGTHERPIDMVFNKGYTPQGFADRVFHLHVRPLGDWPELRFAEVLRSRPEVAAKYANLKEQLAIQHKHHRDNYTDAKTEFIVHHSS